MLFRSPKKRIVITGFGSDFDLSEWTPSCGMVIPLKKLDEYTAEITERIPGAPDESQKTAELVKPVESADPAAVKPAAAQKTATSAKPVTQKKNAAPKKETESVKPAGREEGKP